MPGNHPSDSRLSKRQPFFQNKPGNRRLRRLALAGVVVAFLFGGAAVAGYVYYKKRTGDIYHPHAAFTNEAPPQLPPPASPQTHIDRFAWPLYGYTPDHQRNFPAPATMHPPFKQSWARNDGVLLEFPPVMYGNRLFQLSDDGTVRAISKFTGKNFWTQRVGTLSASTPALARDNA